LLRGATADPPEVGSYHGAPCEATPLSCGPPSPCASPRLRLPFCAARAEVAELADAGDSKPAQGSDSNQDAPTTAENFSIAVGALLVAVGTSRRLFTDRTRTAEVRSSRGVDDFRTARRRGPRW